jgi:ribosome biogenesis GTPase
MAELMPLPYGGFVVDTPGLKEFGLWQAGRIELQGAFPEIAAAAENCRFANCSHTHEPDCAVLAAVADGAVDEERYGSYTRILDEALGS